MHSYYLLKQIVYIVTTGLERVNIDVSKRVSLIQKFLKLLTFVKRVYVGLHGMISSHRAVKRFQ